MAPAPRWTLPATGLRRDVHGRTGALGHDAGGKGEIIGSVTVGKPVQTFGQFVAAARSRTLYVGLLSVLAVLVLAVTVSVWLVRPFGLIADYARYVRRSPAFTRVACCAGAGTLLRAAYDEMRDALAGRNYVADYVQTLTHEVKSPLSAIRGAAELLQEPMEEAQRQRFLGNIQRETQRIQEMVDRMLELTTLETRRVLDAVQSPWPCCLCWMSWRTRRKALLRSGAGSHPHHPVRRAVSNLRNALDFSTPTPRWRPTPFCCAAP
jgi:signal transduction histidine kinase